MKKFLSVMVILGFMGGASLSIFAMNHNHGSPTKGDCPVAPFSVSVCPTGALSMASHSISMYQAFTNGIVSLFVVQILMISLLFITIVYVLRREIFPIQHLSMVSRNFHANLRRPQAITRWLSLLVNSPSFN